MSRSETNYIYISTNEELAHYCSQWRGQEFLALDTEFMRSKTFYPHLALLQIADAYGVYIVDPVAISDKSIFAELLQLPSITWVIHSCTEDLETLEHFYGAIPAQLFDTQVAAHFADLGDSLGYAGLVELLESITVPKEQTRSDWLKRPLSPAQLNYAALDVKFLLSLREALAKRLNEQQKSAWFTQECALFITRSSDTPEYYLRVNNAWKLTPKQLALLRALCAWREEMARALDVPRNHFVDSQCLWEIAAKAPEQVKKLRFINKLTSHFIDEYGEKVIAIIESVESLSSDHYPLPLMRPLGGEGKKQLKLLQKVNARQAEHNKLSPSLLCRKKDFLYVIDQTQNSRLNDLLADESKLPKHLSSWRYDLIVKPLLMASLEWNKVTEEQH